MNNIAVCDKWKRFDKNFETCKLEVSINPLRQTVIEGIITFLILYYLFPLLASYD